MLEPIKFHTRINIKDNVWSKAAVILHDKRGFASIPVMRSGVLLEADDTVTSVLQASWSLMQDMSQ